jgi:integrase
VATGKRTHFTASRASRKIPKFRRHKASGQAFVELSGRRIYLGRHDRPDARAEYDRVIAEWLAAGRQLPVPPEDLTVVELLARFLDYAETYYGARNGGRSTELINVKRAIGFVRQLYGHCRVSEFGPRALMAVRQRMVDEGRTRKSLNRMVARVVMAFRWGVKHELIPREAAYALGTVGGLKQGECGVQDAEPVRPVAPELIEAVRPHISRQVRALVDLQLLTGARPGELVILRPKDLNRTGPVWSYKPERHKTAHRGHVREIFVGPKAQAVLRPFLLRHPEAFCFSPAEAEAERLRDRHEARTTPLGYGNAPGTNRRRRPQRTPGDRYDTKAYNRAVARACNMAFPSPDHLARRPGESPKAWGTRLTAAEHVELATWRKRHCWHVHQLRHNAATSLRSEFGLDVAAAVLGHRTLAVTDGYAEQDLRKAAMAMAKIG